MNLLRKFACAIALSGVIAAMAADVKVTATADSVDVMQGMLRRVDVEVNQPAGMVFRWLSDPMKEGEVVEIAPGVDVNSSSAIDTTDLGNSRLQLRRTILVQPWDSGEVLIENIALVSETDTFRSNPIALKVYTADVDTMTTINGLQAPVSPRTGVFDWVPDWLADWWWAFITIAAAATAIWFIHKRMRKPAVENSAVQVIVPPYEKAINELEVLRNRKLCEKGEEKTYYTELTEILRQYLEGRFGINAMEMTTPQIKRAVRASVPAASASALMAEVLEMADYVKFAKLRPMPEDNVRAFQQALNFVEDTKPLPQAEDTGKEEDKK